LSAYSDSVSNFDAGLDVFANLDDLSDDFVANAEGCDTEISPTSGDGVHIRSADTAAFIHDINIAIFEDLWSDLEIC